LNHSLPSICCLLFTRTQHPKWRFFKISTICRGCPRYLYEWHHMKNWRTQQSDRRWISVHIDISIGENSHQTLHDLSRFKDTICTVGIVLDTIVVLCRWLLCPSMYLHEYSQSHFSLWAKSRWEQGGMDWNASIFLLYKELIITYVPQLFESLLCGSENVFWAVGLVRSFPLSSFTVADNSASNLLRNLQSWAVIRDRNRPPAGSFRKLLVLLRFVK
jgi:hypothetical protein